MPDMTHQNANLSAPQQMTLYRLPREISPGVFWLGSCNELSYRGRTLHSYNSVYLVAGEERSMIVEGGHPARLHNIESQIDELLADGIPEPEYIFLTHTETPHAAGVGRLLERFPHATVHGDVSDLPYIFEDYAERIHGSEIGDSFDLGGRRVETVEAVFRDHITTRWAFDRRSRTLFTGDGFSYSHYHEADQCGHLAEEVEKIDLPDMVSLFAGLAFNWTLHTNIEPYLKRLDALIFDQLNASLISPTHGLPIGNPQETMPAIREGLRIGSGNTEVGMLAYVEKPRRRREF